MTCYRSYLNASLCQRSRWLTYVDDELLEGNEEDSENELHHS